MQEHGGHGGVVKGGISGFIICLIPALFANQEVQSLVCSCSRQGRGAAVCRRHVPTGTLKVCAAAGALIGSETQSVKPMLPCSAEFEVESCSTLPSPLTHTHTLQVSP